MAVFYKRKKSRYKLIELSGKLGELVAEDTPQEIVKNTSNVVTSNENITSQSSTIHDTVQGNGKLTSIENGDNSNERKNDGD